MREIQEPTVIKHAREHINATTVKSHPLSDYLNDSPKMTRRTLFLAGLGVFSAGIAVGFALDHEDNVHPEILQGKEPIAYFDGDLRLDFRNMSIYNEEGTEIPQNDIIRVNNITEIKDSGYEIQNPLFSVSPLNETQKALRLNITTSQSSLSSIIGYIPLSEIYMMNDADFDSGKLRPINIDDQGNVFYESTRVAEPLGTIKVVSTEKDTPYDTEEV